MLYGNLCTAVWKYVLCLWKFNCLYWPVKHFWRYLCSALCTISSLHFVIILYSTSRGHLALPRYNTGAWPSKAYMFPKLKFCGLHLNTCDHYRHISRLQFRLQSAWLNALFRYFSTVLSILVTHSSHTIFTIHVCHYTQFLNIYCMHNSQLATIKEMQVLYQHMLVICENIKSRLISSQPFAGMSHQVRLIVQLWFAFSVHSLFYGHIFFF